MPVIPAMLGSTVRSIIVWAGLVIKCDPIAKITNAKMAGGVA
jgi:hypothetical protein